MNTVGSLLKGARIAKGYSFEQVEAATKIRTKFLEAIEADDYRQLPSVAYAKGFVRNYSEFLGLNSEKILAFFRRQTQEFPRSAILPKGITESLNRSRWQLTPGKFLTILALALLGIFLLYFGLQYRRFRLPPGLSLEKPVNQEVVSQKRVEVIGKTDPDATVTINGITTIVKSDGSFFDQVTLETGINKITITAISRFGKTATKVIEVGLRPP